MNAAITAAVPAVPATHDAPPRGRAHSWRDALAVAEAPRLHARTLQLLLVRAGHLDADAACGRFDHATAAAVRAYQRSAGLEITGVASQATADALLAACPESPPASPRQSGGSSSRRCPAHAAACERRWKPSFRSSWLTWLRTVFSERCSTSPMARLV